MQCRVVTRKELYAVEKKTLEKLIAKYQNRADIAEQALQETGLTRYNTTFWNNQEMADALRLALSAKDDHDALLDMRMMLSNFATRGAAATSPHLPQEERVELAMKLSEEIADYGRRNGLI